MPSQLRGIPPNTKILGTYATPDLAGLMLLINWLFILFYPASKA
jgi:hypothetical protein